MINEEVLTQEMKEEILMFREFTMYSDLMLAVEMADLNGFRHLCENWDILVFLGQLHKYGKIQGIREERARRKKALAKSSLAREI